MNWFFCIASVFCFDFYQYCFTIGWSTIPRLFFVVFFFSTTKFVADIVVTFHYLIQAKYFQTGERHEIVRVYTQTNIIQPARSMWGKDYSKNRVWIIRPMGERRKKTKYSKQNNQTLFGFTARGLFALSGRNFHSSETEFTGETHTHAPGPSSNPSRSTFLPCFMIAVAISERFTTQIR